MTNEMIKFVDKQLMPGLNKLFNTILSTGSDPTQ